MLIIPGLLLSSGKLPTAPNNSYPHHYLHLYLCAKLLSYPAGNLNDSGQGLEKEGMWSLLERINWTTLPGFLFSAICR